MRPDGANLPLLHETTAWLRAAQVPLTADALGKHVLDATIGLANLNTRGYHLARVTAQVLQFPQAHRSAP